MEYNLLKSPKKINNLEIKNRVVMTAMGAGLANLDGTPSDKMIQYYEERAKGGVGLIVTEITRVNDETGVGLPAQLSVSNDNVIPKLTKLAEAVHKWGSKIFVQLHHPGRQTYSQLIGDKPVVAPSAIPCGICKQETRALENAEIKELVQQHIEGAKRAKQAGIDGVELHGAHGYLIAQFLSSHTNKRTDEYGGSVENRFRFTKEIIEGIKQACGEDYPVTIRLNATDFLGLIGVEEGITNEECVTFAKMSEEAGADLINVSCGIYETINTIIEPTSFQEGWRLDLSKLIKANVSIPVFGNTVIRSPKYAEQLLEEGVVDFIGMGRTHLADSEWVNKALSGREDEIRKCVSCVRCFESLNINAFTLEPLVCSVNPRTCREADFKIDSELEKNGEGKTVAIVGAGPAGLEAARILSLRNYKPVIFEKEDKIGGQLYLAKEPPHKDKLGWFIDYYKTQLNDVEIKLNTEATIENIKAINPCSVIIATGAKPIVPSSICGVDSQNVYTTTNILDGSVEIKNETVAVIGSGMTGIETAELLAENNKIVLVEMAEEIAPGCYVQNVVDVMGRLGQKDVVLLPKHKLTSISENTISLQNENGENVTYDVDKVVLSLGVERERSLVEQFEKEFDEVNVIGDSDKIGRIAEAVFAGYSLAYNL